jgi:hypothetical protein
VSVRMNRPPRRGVKRLRDKELRAALLALPPGAHDGWNRYDTDTEHVLHLWADGESFDIRVDRIADPLEVGDERVQHQEWCRANPHIDSRLVPCTCIADPTPAPLTTRDCPYCNADAFVREDGKWECDFGHVYEVAARPADAKRGRPGCDLVGCAAVFDPQTPDEYRAAYEHWSDHGYISGCSHGC